MNVRFREGRRNTTLWKVVLDLPRGVAVLLQKGLKEKAYGLASGSFFRSCYRGLDGAWRDRQVDNRYVVSLQVVSGCEGMSIGQRRMQHAE